MNMLKVTLNGDDAARFLKIKERLNYDSNAKIVKTLIVQFIRHHRKAKTEKPDEDHKSLYGGAINPREEGLQVEHARYVTTGRRLKLIKNPENRVKRDPLQIKVRLTDRETKTLDEIIENSGGKVRSHYQIAKTLIRELLKYNDGGFVSERDQSGLKRFKMAQAEAGDQFFIRRGMVIYLTPLTLTRARFFWTVGVKLAIFRV